MASFQDCPQNYQEAILSPDSENWRQAMDKEFESIRNAKTWELREPMQISFFLTTEPYQCGAWPYNLVKSLILTEIFCIEFDLNILYRI